jgi:DNA-binding transcriptional MerR regulator
MGVTPNTQRDADHMPLKLTVDSIDEVPETLRELYTEKDGKFALAVEGLEDTSGLKTALEAERRNAREAGKLAKAYRDLGMSADEIKAIVAEKQTREQEEAKKSGNFEALRKQDREQFEKDLAARQERIAALEKTTRQAVVGNQLMAALTKAGASQEGIDLLPDRLSSRIKFEFDGDSYRHTVMLADGETPMAGSGKDGNATFDDLVKESIDKWPSLFRSAGSAGSGKLPGSAGGAGKRTITLAEFANLHPKDQAARMAEGVTLTE